MKNYPLLTERYIVNTYPNRYLTFTHGNGVYLYDNQKEKYLDMMSNYGVNIFGYNHKKINKSIITQVQKLTNLHGSFNNEIRIQASSTLIDRCGPSYHQVYWSNSGAEAIEAALKFAVLTTKKRRFIVCDHAYHGKTLGALSATAGDKYRSPFLPLLWEFVRIPFNNISSLEQTIDENTTGFIVEPIQGEGGLVIPHSNYLKEVRKLCSQKNILLILDEIQTGAGRTGYFLASQESKVDGDIVCLGKGIAGGLPVGLTIINEKVAQMIPKNSHTSTFGGNPLTCATTLTTLELLTNKQLNKNIHLGNYFMQLLSEIKSPFIKQIRGKGFMIGIEVTDKRNEILKLFQLHHILVIPAGNNVIRFLPPYLITKKHIEIAVKQTHKIFQQL